MKNNRKHTRLISYDYSLKGLYFITFCTNQKACTLSKIQDDKNNAAILLKPLGAICKNVCEETQHRYSEFSVEQLVIMPNHVHALIAINENPNTHTISDFIGAWKRESTRRAHLMGINERIWQRSFYDHIIRDEEDMLRIMQYIEENPKKWTLDRFYQE